MECACMREYRLIIAGCLLTAISCTACQTKSITPNCEYVTVELEYRGTYLGTAPPYANVGYNIISSIPPVLEPGLKFYITRKLDPPVPTNQRGDRIVAALKRAQIELVDYREPKRYEYMDPFETVKWWPVAAAKPPVPEK